MLLLLLASGAAPEITTTEIDPATVGTPYAYTLLSTGETPITWSVTVGSLPSWATLDDGTGEISGTPDAADEHAFTVQALNEYGSDTLAVTLTVSLGEEPVATGTSRRRVIDPRIFAGRKRNPPTAQALLARINRIMR